MIMIVMIVIIIILEFMLRLLLKNLDALQ